MLTAYDSNRDSGVPIETAYSELSQEAFAAWIRLHVADKTEMVGRKKMCKILEYSEGRSNVILRELKLKGYVKFIPGPNPGVPTKFILLKKVLLAGNSQFINLASHLWDGSDVTVKTSHAQSGKTLIDRFQAGLFSVQRSVSNPQAFKPKRTKSKSLPDSVLEVLKANKATKQAKRADKIPRKVDDASAIPSSSVNSPHPEKSADISKNANQSSQLEGNQTAQIPCKTGFDHNKDNENNKLSQPGESILTPNIDLEKLKTKNKTHPKGVCSAANKKLWARKRQQIDWSKPEPGRKPTITFTPGPKQRTRMIEILERPKSNTERKAMVAKLGSEFLRIYSRYRRTKEISYATVPQEKKHAENVAILCIYKGVTPTQLIAYWEEHIGDFTDMKVPPLTFLMSAGNVDRVACEVGMNNGKLKQSSTKDKRPDGPMPNGHAYSDTSRLDSRLRPALIEAGFDLKQYDDRYLLTIQSAARSVARGTNMFVSRSMKAMVEWAAMNLYSPEACDV